MTSLATLKATLACFLKLVHPLHTQWASAYRYWDAIFPFKVASVKRRFCEILFTSYIINSKLTADCLIFGLLLLLPTKRALDYALFDHSHSNISLLVLESNLGYLFLMKRAHRPFTYLNKRQVPIVAFVEEIVTYLYGRDSEALIA